MRKVAAGMLLLVVAAIVLGMVYFARARTRARLEEKWISDAEPVVADFLREPRNQRPYPATPGGAPPVLGQFIELRGEGYGGAGWNTQGYEYLVADRMARFANGDLPVKIYVEEGSQVAPLSKDVVVRMSQWSTGERDGSFAQKVFIHVSHPDLQ